MDNMVKRIFDIGTSEPVFATLDDQQKYQLIHKINMLINIVDDYAPTCEQQLLDTETSLVEVEEQIITTVKSLMAVTDTEHNNTALAKLKYLCSQKMVVYKYSTWYYESC
jgi:hypothetical protein